MDISLNLPKNSSKGYFIVISISLQKISLSLCESHKNRLYHGTYHNRLLHLVGHSLVSIGYFSFNFHYPLSNTWCLSESQQELGTLSVTRVYEKYGSSPRYHNITTTTFEVYVQNGNFIITSKTSSLRRDRNPVLLSLCLYLL